VAFGWSGMARPTVLVVEDDDAIREVVSFALARANVEVREAADAESATRCLDGVDAVVLDWMLPGVSGLVWLQRMRDEQHSATPVLMLTARASETDRVEGLEAGADDYLVKPFSMAELVARVRALLRRVRPQVRFSVGPLTVDVDAALVTVDGRVVTLTPREFALLAFLAGHPGRVFTRAELLDRVWGEEFVGTDRTVDQHVAQLRARIGATSIDTVRGRGYRLVERPR
jgi:two-component system, OmpR family, response regulator RegX3